MKRLIVNADDFGLTHGVNAGIIRAFKDGILTSATLMANGDAFDDAVELARANPELGVGCHLAAVGGRPVSAANEINSLVSDDGRLPATLSELMIKIARGKVQIKDIEREFASQVERAIRAGITPTHLDTHKHTHTHPRVMKAVAKVAREFNIKCVRNPFESVFAAAAVGPAARARRKVYLKQCAMSAAIAPRAARFKRMAREHGLIAPDHFRGVRLTGLLDSEAVCNIIRSLSEGVTELMCHPGVYDDALERERTRLKQERERELEALIDPAVRRAIDEWRIKLINYREMAKNHV
ncbi:MAG TPA: ChbG/HpnK family deacetylase [Blastocatellia bacterium]|nr:ChbG/HpnK family deacetylase [Blastocatellia bacterium]